MNAVGKRIPDELRVAPHDDTIVLWVFRDYENRWCVRIEGEDGERDFPSRKDAIAAARHFGVAWGSYRLYLPLKDGRVTAELFNLQPRPLIPWI